MSISESTRAGIALRIQKALEFEVNDYEGRGVPAAILLGRMEWEYFSLPDMEVERPISVHPLYYFAEHAVPVLRLPASDGIKFRWEYSI